VEFSAADLAPPPASTQITSPDHARVGKLLATEEAQASLLIVLAALIEDGEAQEAPYHDDTV
jgi:hypothetical protein